MSYTILLIIFRDGGLVVLSTFTSSRALECVLHSDRLLFTTACLIRATYTTIKKKVIKSVKWHISQLQLYISRVDIFNLFLNTVYLYMTIFHHSLYLRKQTSFRHIDQDLADNEKTVWTLKFNSLCKTLCTYMTIFPWITGINL
jgi:hypothetical protein